MKNSNLKELCDKWLANKNVNPETMRKITTTGAIYKKLSKKCSLNPNPNPNPNIKITQNEICNKWLANKNVNPETMRKITETGAIYKKLEKKCLIKAFIKPSTKSSTKPSIRPSIKPSIRPEIKPSIRPEIRPVLNSEEKKKNALKKIHKLFIPYVNRTSVNIIDRINYYIIMKKYLLTIKDTNNCLRLYNIDANAKNIMYRIGSKIILDKQIGTPSVYGIVFLSHFKSNIRYGNKFDKLNKFAVKITDQSKSNRRELEVLKKLTKLVIDFKCPHFPISYGSLECNKPNLKSNNTDDYSIVKNKHNDKRLFPELINKNKSFLIQLNELASGDFHSLITSLKQINIFNNITQVLISLMFFHHYAKSYHRDSHTGNFLYHKIKPGGYFYYNIYGKDYYLENTGYLWVIWDFGLIKKFGGPNTEIIFDFKNTLNAINYYNWYLSTEDKNIKTLLYNELYKYTGITDHKKLQLVHQSLLNILLANEPTFTNIRPSLLINKKPYIIK